ncbi:unnamed protein product [Toxocara canis]|uniref:Uncharacterized protein n=1 Tax=Toxocara canis TaxID=6265 RepID=A0A183UEW0_TOXCA|nr:unnamed protein product [Toxocara canis]
MCRVVTEHTYVASQPESIGDVRFCAYVMLTCVRVRVRVRAATFSGRRMGTGVGTGVGPYEAVGVRWVCARVWDVG